MRLRWVGHNDDESIQQYLLSGLEDADSWWVLSARMLVEFIEYIEHQENVKDAWIVISMQSLIFTLSPQGGVGVKVGVIQGTFEVEYPLIGRDAPWPGAVIVGRTKEVSQAATMLSTALQQLSGE